MAARARNNTLNPSSLLMAICYLMFAPFLEGAQICYKIYICGLRQPLHVPQSFWEMNSGVQITHANFHTLPHRPRTIIYFTYLRYKGELYFIIRSALRQQIRRDRKYIIYTIGDTLKPPRFVD